MLQWSDTDNSQGSPDASSAWPHHLQMMPRVALVRPGKLDVQLQAGRKGSLAAVEHLQRSREAYERALQDPSSCGSLQERWDVRHNYACALAQGAAAFCAAGAVDASSHKDPGVRASLVCETACTCRLRNLPCLAEEACTAT